MKRSNCDGAVYTRVVGKQYGREVVFTTDRAPDAALKEFFRIFPDVRHITTTQLQQVQVIRDAGYSVMFEELEVTEPGEVIQDEEGEVEHDLRTED